MKRAADGSPADGSPAGASSRFSSEPTFEDMRSQLQSFASARDWDQFHTPRNLALALVGEVGELCELFQWTSDAHPPTSWPEAKRQNLREELADVATYLVRLADKCDVDLPAAISGKLAKNARKYPASLVRGSSKKYTEYSAEAAAAAADADEAAATSAAATRE